MDLVLMCCNRTVIYYYNYYSAKSADMASNLQGQINLDLTFQSHARSKATSLIDRLKYACDVTRDPSSNTNSCISVTTVMDVSQLYRAYIRDNMWSRRLCRVVKRKSCETYWILLLGRLIELWRRMCRLRSQSRQSQSAQLKFVHQYVLTCSHWWTTFQLLTLLSLWLSMSTGLWPQTTHASSFAPVGSSRTWRDSGRVCGGRVNFLLIRFRLSFEFPPILTICTDNEITN